MKQTRRQFVRTLFAASQAVAVGSLLPGSLFARSRENDGLGFLVLGDWGRRGGEGQSEVARQMALEAAAAKARFVVAVGDNFYEDGVKSPTDPQWRESFEDIYTADSLQVPWHAILGNHDYHGNCDAQIDYSRTSQRWNMPARYFQRTESVGAGCDVDFLFLDTTPMAEAADDSAVSADELRHQNLAEQLAWLENTLAASKAPWKIVFGHHPVYSGGVHGDTPFLIEHILPMLRRHGVQAYFNGHDHDLQHLQAEGVNFFCSGAGSAVRETTETRRTRFAKGHTPGFVSATLTAEHLDLRMIDSEGRVLYTCEVSRLAA